MRKPTRIAVLVAAVVPLSAAVMACGVSRSAAADRRAAAATITDSGSLWRQTNANPALSRDNADERVLTTTTIRKARLLRTFHPLLSAPIDDAYCGDAGPEGYADSPLFEPGGRLFVGTENSVTEYNPNNGVVKDQIALGTEHNAYLSIARGVLVADGTNCDSVSDPTGFAEAHNALTGKAMWQGDPAVDNDEGVGSVNMVQDGSRVIAAFGSVSGINLTTGTTEWDQGDCAPYLQPFIAGGHVITQTCTANGTDLSALNEATGAVLWSRAADFIPIRADRSSAAPGAQVYVQRGNGDFAALDADDGATLYNLRGANSVLAADGSRVYAGCGEDTSDICAYSKKNGALLWHATETGDQTRQYPAGYVPLIAVGGNVVYVANGDVLNRATGKSITQLWTTGTATSLAVGDGYVAADTGDGSMQLFGLPS